jgi:putative nucleotidyltransferase with HDIG domain
MEMHDPRAPTSRGPSLPARIDDDAAAVPADEPAARSEPRAKHPRTVTAYIALLCVAAAAIGLFSSRGQISADPWLFVGLVAAVVLIDAIRIDVFERANLSPAAVPEIALAFFFGPLGPLCAEAVIALGRFGRRDPVLKWTFDFGALSLAGAAAAGTFSIFSSDTGPALFGIAVLAGTAYYLVNSALLAIVMALAEGRSPADVWRERLAWMVPHYVVFGLLAAAFIASERALGLSAFVIFGLPMLMLWIAEKQYLDRSRAAVSELRTSNDELEAANARLRGLLDDNQRLMGRMHRAYLSTITSLARTIEAKDPYTRGHTERVARIAMLLAVELGLDESRLPAIETGAVIHDIGKVGIPDEILLKRGPLDNDQLGTIRTHTELSSYILAELELPQIVKQMARSHHERYDGNGYPDGLVGEEIPLVARILSVADALDAMTSDRPYRRAMTLESARAEIERESGTQFCPRAVAALMKIMDSTPEFQQSFPHEGGTAEPADLSIA